MKRTTLTILMILVIANQVGSQTQSKRFKFQPDGCEFYVYFPSQPEINQMSMETTTGVRINVIRAVVRIPDQDSFLRAEFTPKFANSLDAEGDQALIDGAFNFAKNDGLQTPIINVENGKYGKIVNVRGYKTLRGISITYENKNFYGETTLLSLTVGGPSKSYPAPQVNPFFKSVGK